MIRVKAKGVASIVMMALVLTGCSYTSNMEYYEVRDKAVVDVLKNCSSGEEKVFNIGFTVKDLVVSFVDIRHKLDTCVIVTEEVIELLGGS